LWIKIAPQFRATSVISKKLPTENNRPKILPKENNRPKGEKFAQSGHPGLQSEEGVWLEELKKSMAEPRFLWKEQADRVNNTFTDEISNQGMDGGGRIRTNLLQVFI
jgi:hypothetical protein